MIDAWSTEALKASKGLFGRPLRVLLANWIIERDGDWFYLQQAQDAMRVCGQATSSVASELRKFVEYGMLSETPDQQRVYFAPLESPLWVAFEAVALAVLAHAATEVPRP